MIHLRIAGARIEQGRTMCEMEPQLRRNTRSRGELKVIASCASRKERTMANLRTLTLGYNERRRRWDLSDDVSNRVVKSFATKRVATRKGIFEAMFRMRPASVRIETVRGRFQEERTYRGSRDPRRSDG
jgi:hypothetical protein